MDKIEVQKKTSKENDILVVYDIFNKRVGKALELKNENRKNKKEYNKIKIPEIPNENHRYFVGLMKALIEAKDLWGSDNKNEISVEYLTSRGWVGKLDAYNKYQIKEMFSLPKSDKSLPSGQENNLLQPHEQVFIARLNVFKL